MSNLEDLVRDTLAGRAEQAPSAVALLQRVHVRVRRHRNAQRWFAVLGAAGGVAAVVVVSVTIGLRAPDKQIRAAQPTPSAQVFGEPSVGVLTVAVPRADDRATVPEATALEQIEHPSSSQAVSGPPRIVGLARVTAVGGAIEAEQGVQVPTVHALLAWVGVYEVDRDGYQPCPPMTTVPASLPPLMAHYYFVVLVDASTGQVITWSEDESGLTIRRCAGLPVT